MSKRTAGLAAIVVGAALGAGLPALAQDLTPANRHGSAYHIRLTGKTEMTVHDALQGASRRLFRPACQHLFEDFTDRAGRALTVSLAASGAKPEDLLAELYFVDGNDTTPCRTDDATAAFTTPGSRVIYICGKRFVHFAANPKPGEILLIHELLHTLGLGENPPTSSQITNTVISRCGG